MLSKFPTRLFWSLANFGASTGLRFISNIILTRLLAPEVFGVMVVLNVLRFGFELLTDVGIEQNIVRHKDGLEPRFFNTAWTLQMLRGIWITGAFLLTSGPIASFYGIDRSLVMAMAFTPLLNSLHSTAIFGLVKNLDLRGRTKFELKAEAIGVAVSVTLAAFNPTPWALVIGALVAVTARSAMSYALPRPAHFLALDRRFCLDILLFGRWIMISSIIMFAATSLDKIVLGRVAPLAVLGLFGLARTIADLPAQLSRQLAHQLIFPSLTATPSPALDGIRAIRSKLVLMMAATIGVGLASADWAIRLLYGSNFAAAGWMLSLLLVASFVTTLSGFNEGVLLGASRPAFLSGGNLIRIAILVPGLWFGYAWLDLVGFIAAMILAEIGRYVFLCFGLRRVGVSFLPQDAVAALVATLAAGGLIGLRIILDLSTPFETMALN